MVQNVIAMIYDCDLTLSPHYMQDPLFKRFNVDPPEFWEEKSKWAHALESEQGIRVQHDTIYLEYLIEQTKPGKPFAGLTRAVLREEGANIKFFPGIPDFFKSIKDFVESDPEYTRYGITVEHYVATTGLSEMLRGSAIAPHVTKMEACEFRYDENGVPNGVVFHMTHTQKTGVLFDINKGTYNNGEIDINSSIPESKRRVPFRNMMYFGDGPSDVPCMSVLKKNGGAKKDGGFTFAVFNANPTNPNYVKDPAVNAMKLFQQERVDFVAAADYQKGSNLYQLTQSGLRIIANRIVREIEEDLRGSIRAPPGHKEARPGHKE